MSILSDVDILTAIRRGDIAVFPDYYHVKDGSTYSSLQPCSLDLHIDHDLVDPENREFISKNENGNLEIQPGQFVLGSTVERVTLSDRILGQLHGKSSIGRLGLSVHITAGLIDPGFSGQITLEMVNHSNKVIELRPLTPIAQITFETLSSPALRPYGHVLLNSHYQNQQGPTLSALVA